MYQVRYSKRAIKSLRKMDKFDSSSIVNWMVKNIDGKDNPRTQGKALVGDKKGLWRYRVGDYRVLCQIQDDELVVLVVDTGHRRSIYDWLVFVNVYLVNVCKMTSCLRVWGLFYIFNCQIKCNDSLKNTS